MKKNKICSLRGRTLKKCFGVTLITMTCGISAASAFAGDFDSGTNVSGESTSENHRQLFKEDSAPKDGTVRKNDDVRIEVPVKLGPDGLPQKPVRGLSSNEKRELNDLEYRFEQGQISESEYYSRRNEIMKRVGLEPEY